MTNDQGRALDKFLDEVNGLRNGSEPETDVPLEPLAAPLASFTLSLINTGSVQDVLTHVVQAVDGVIPEADLVGITLRSPDGHLRTPIETGGLAHELDQIQYDLGEGPCWDVAKPYGPAVVIAEDLRTEPRWPRFGPVAAERGAAAVISKALIPVSETPRLSGALTVYSRRPHGLDSVNRDLLLLLATHASMAITSADAVKGTAARGELKNAQLRTAINTRDVIGQAKGIIMARRGVTAEQAFDILRKTSQELNIKLVDVAETLTSRHTEIDIH